MILETFAEDFLFYGLLTFALSVTAFLVNREIKRLRKKDFKKKLKLYKLVSIEDISEENAKSLSHHSLINKKLSIDPRRKMEPTVESTVEEKKPIRKVKINIIAPKNDNSKEADDSNKNERTNRVFGR